MARRRKPKKRVSFGLLGLLKGNGYYKAKNDWYYKPELDRWIKVKDGEIKEVING